MYFLRFILIVCFIFFGSITYSQKSTQFVIIGKIIDKSTTEAISNTTVFNILTKKGVISDNNGFFTLKTTKKLTSFEISHLSYNSYTLNISNEQLAKIKNDTLFLSILLTPKQVELASFEINTEKQVEIAYKRGGRIIDYELYGDNVLLLYKEKNSYSLELVNDLDSSLNSKNLNLKSAKLIMDCFGNSQVIGADSVIQVNISNNTILVTKNSIKAYNDFLQPCIAATEQQLFFKEEISKHNQGIFYFTIDRSTQKKSTLLHIYDKAADRYAQSYYNENIYFYYRHVDPIANIIEAGIWDGDIMKLLLPGIESTILVSYYLKIATRPIYNPLYSINDSIVVFNHFTDSLMIYNNNGELKRTVTINYHHKKGWKKNIIIDEEKQNAYAQFLIKGIMYLYQINLTTGEIGDVQKLNSHLYPEEIKIKGDYIYYLYLTSGELNTHLYKQFLE
ncbi:MAG: carboxypeptidase-like regulatory domain-containing protein [Flavobacteriales bacterium]|nr:carboxypeptidase-like regulatory domain-containing protein [Flavobacteriales bacterium]